jgi:hypothetical protein
MLHLNRVYVLEVNHGLWKGISKGIMEIARMKFLRSLLEITLSYISK